MDESEAASSVIIPMFVLKQAVSSELLFVLGE